MTLQQRMLVGLTCACAALALLVPNNVTGLFTAVLTLAGWLLLAVAAAWLLRPLLRRLAQATAWLGLFLLLLALPGLLLLPLGHAVAVLVIALVVMLAAGAASVWRAALPEGMAAPPVTLLLAAKVLLDELIMGYFITSLRFPRGHHRQQVMSACRQAMSGMQDRGWLSDPVSLHPPAATPERFELAPAEYKGRSYQRLRFASSFTGLDLPGSSEWLAQPQQVQARVMEHADGPRPWLMCIHGYRMGWLPIDFQLFPPGWLHNKLGFNLIMPVLPLHGGRRLGWRSGDGLFDGDVMRMLHAIVQGVHDLRCLLNWLRHERQAQNISVLGYSLGGLHAALLACLENDLDKLIAGIPLVEIPLIMQLNSPRSLINDFDDQGLDHENLERLLAPIRPLAMQPRLAPDRLGVLAAYADRLVPMEPVIRLAEHWGQEQSLWYAGSHLSVRRERAVRDWLVEQWANAGLLGEQLNAQPQEG